MCFSLPKNWFRTTKLNCITVWRSSEFWLWVPPHSLWWLQEGPSLPFPYPGIAGYPWHPLASGYVTPVTVVLFVFFFMLAFLLCILTLVSRLEFTLMILL